MGDNALVRVVVSGRVQGVFFRAFVVERARQLNLAGYVRNLYNGEVEVVAEGNKTQLEEMVHSLKAGPPAARVDRISLQWSKYSGLYESFTIR